ncbi:MAG: ABC transporter permease [Chloroflexi bacterium]|nr:ABC transporter permease [Chloroflexota bacterium]MBT4074253.1 ABC transporter permease [Chloroflexota bacterium]MBT4515662.1 ABC transporter permease [Chloroflexota bacterium]MBT6682434.1 ABC transporter permease [Chloroflexota bacterium]
MNRQIRRKVIIILTPVLASALLLAVWETWVRVKDVKEYLLPTPSAVLTALIDDPGRYAEGARLSLQAALGGLLLASLGAFILAVAMAHSRALERALYPPALALKVTPVVAVAPLFTIWFGFGLAPKVLIAAMITFFPMLVNSVVGLRSIDPRAHDFMRTINASPWQIFWRLRVPSSLPYVFAGLRISVPLSLIGAVVAEFLSGSAGMGQIILIANGDFDTPALFGAIFVLAALGIVLTSSVALVERRVLFWHHSSVSL